MKTYLILIMAVVASLYEGDAQTPKVSTTVTPQVNVYGADNKTGDMISASLTEPNTLARKAGGRKYRLFHKLKKAREKREAKSRMA